jgi:acyl-CoA reductase-like NAD-dependent aldehyde dehydrogenase
MAVYQKDLNKAAEPTLFCDVTNDMEQQRKNLWLVLSVIRPDENDAVHIANASSYGLTWHGPDNEEHYSVAKKLK